MSELPVGWCEANLLDLCQPKQWKVISTAELTDTGYVVYGANGKIGYYSTYTHKNPTLMITCRGATCGNLHVSEPQSYINGNAMALDDLAEQATSIGYLKYVLQARGLTDAITGSAQPQITRQSLSEVTVRLAPRAEQTRITQKLDELLAQVDTLKARIDAIPVLLKRFRQSALAAAISGRLTEEWRKHEPNGLIDEWIQIEVGDLCTLKSGIAISADYEKTTGDFKYFKVGEMNIKGNEYCLQHTARYLNKGDAPEKSLMPSGSILFPKRGGAIATNKKRLLKEPSFVDLNIMGIIVPADVETMYIYRWFETIDLAKLNTGSTIPQVNNTDIAPLVIPLPPAAEQIEIVRRVEQLFAFADQLEAKVASAKSRIDHLTQSILAKAFRGELVPQDPNDEPASALLQRIKAQRAAAPKAKRGRKASA